MKAGVRKDLWSIDEGTGGAGPAAELAGLVDCGCSCLRGNPALTPLRPINQSLYLCVKHDRGGKACVTLQSHRKE